MDKTSAILPAALEQYRIAENEGKKKSSELGQQQFFDLMVTQLKNQDPMKPMESGDFLGQIAQFGTVNGITELQTSFATLASSLQSNQALQASTMVGRDVLLPRDKVVLAKEGSAEMATKLPEAASNVRVTLSDTSGQVVRQFALGPKDAGNLKLTWDGVMDNGKKASPGTYSMKVEASMNGQMQALESLVRARVDSVSLGRNGLPPTLNVNGIGAVDMADVLEIL